jgi:hypothetical protein
MGLGEARTTLPSTPNLYSDKSVGALRFQCITVTANTIIMAALSEPITASGTISPRYCIATPDIDLFAGKHWSSSLVRWNRKKIPKEKRGTFCDEFSYPH